MCNLKKYKTEMPTHYVGKTGNEYPIEDYNNHGWEGIKTISVQNIGLVSKKDLPNNEYPYYIKYKTKYMFKCCEVCNCEK
jgi:hypothetical protein